MGSAVRTWRAFDVGLREYARTPVLLGLLAFLPVYFVGIFTYVLPATELPVSIPGSGRRAVSTTHLYGVLLVPLLSGLIGGIAGLFLMRAARDADARLVLAGYRPHQLILARLALLLVASAVATGVALVALAPTYVPESLGVFAAVSVLSGVVYGLFGSLVGILVGRLVGVYTMLFVPMLDVFFIQNPTVEEELWLAPYLPGYAIAELAVDAGLSTTVAFSPFIQALGAVVVVTTLATGAFYRTARSDR